MKDKNAAARTDSDINSRIARKVRQLRAEQGLSLAAFAARCEVSRSMLSLIERGESSPTTVVLDKIATGFGVSVSTLLDDLSAPANPLSRRADHTIWRDPESGYVRRSISPANFPSPIQIVDVTFPAGAKVSYDAAPHPLALQQHLWMLEGSMEITVGTLTYRLSLDDCLVLQLSDSMTFHNRTRKPARYVLAVTGEPWSVQRGHRSKLALSHRSIRRSVRRTSRRIVR